MSHAAMSHADSYASSGRSLPRALKKSADMTGSALFVSLWSIVPEAGTYA